MIEIRKAAARPDFEAVHQLISLLAAWDVEKTGDMGLPTDDVVTRYYADGVDVLAEKYSTQRTPFLVGHLEGQPVACGALFDAGGGIAEIHKMFVRPDCRGKGVAKAMMGGLIEEATNNGYRHLRLETATFMTAAIQLYRAYGFIYCQPFNAVPPGLRAITIFMERQL